MPCFYSSEVHGNDFHARRERIKTRTCLKRKLYQIKNIQISSSIQIPQSHELLGVMKYLFLHVCSYFAFRKDCLCFSLKTRVINTVNEETQLGMVACACSSHTWETEAGGLPLLHSEFHPSFGQGVGPTIKLTCDIP